MQIELAEIQDAGTLLAIQKQAFLSEGALYDDYQIPPLTQTLAQFQDLFSQKTILKVVIDDEIVATGQAMLAEQTCHIGRLAVKPEYQNQGIGSKLLQALESVFSCDKAQLFTGDKSIENIALYQAKGYHIVKRQVVGNTNLVFLQKRLT